MKEKIGLVVGKFSPLHKGHQYLIESALAQCQHLIVISYSVPEFKSCDAESRKQWIEREYPHTTCIALSTSDVYSLCEKWGLPFATNAAHEDTHRVFCARLLPQPVDIVFTSETYGVEFAQYLTHYFGREVLHKMVDIKRKHIPISATDIRHHSAKCNEFLSVDVSSEYSKRSVLLLGGESTGKSTLSEALAKHFGEPLCDEYGRELWTIREGKLLQDDFLLIAETQITKEQKARSDAASLYFCDTSPLTTWFYHQIAGHGENPLLQCLSHREYDHVYLLAPDFPMVQDGTRQPDAFRQHQHQWYLDSLSQMGWSHTVLTGSWQEKFERIVTDCFITSSE